MDTNTELLRDEFTVDITIGSVTIVALADNMVGILTVTLNC